MENKKSVFKENWLKVDKTCEKCGQVTERQKGLTKQNLKRLITPQWNMQEIIITFMLIMVILLAYVYISETKQCREWVASMFAGDKNECKVNCNLQCEKIQPQNNSITNISNITIQKP